MPKVTVYFDGKYIKADPRLLGAFVPGVLPFNGVFETIRYAGGVIEFIDEHVGRLMAGLKILSIRHGFSVSGLKAVLRQVVKKNSGIKSGRLRLMVFQAGGHTHCLATMAVYHPPSAQQYRRGLRLKLIKTRRPATARFAGVKSLDYTLFARAHQQALAAGCDDALLVNAAGRVFEASRANIFIVREGALVTPPLSCGCLNGIGRRTVMAIARRLGIKVREQNLTPAMVRRGGKIFLTNSLMGMMPVGRIIK